MKMIGLGCGEHDAIDARREKARPQAVRSGPEAAEDLGHGAFEVGDRRLAAVQRSEHVDRSEEHTSELQSLMRISYAVFCLKKKTHKQQQVNIQHCQLHN